MHSETLGLDLLADRNGELRFRDPETGRILLAHEEAEAARERAESRAETAESHAETAESRAETAESRAETAESRVAELEALLRRRQG